MHRPEEIQADEFIATLEAQAQRESDPKVRADLLASAEKSSKQHARSAKEI
jgi:hypothetical protein